MRVIAEIKEVEGHNAFCRNCFEDERASYSWNVAKEKSTIPKGEKALKISVSTKSGGRVYLCLLHAECLAEDIVRQI